MVPFIHEKSQLSGWLFRDIFIAMAICQSTKALGL
jgi:hypothetical protein